MEVPIIILVIVTILVLALIGFFAVLKAIFSAFSGDRSEGQPRRDNVRCPYCERWTSKTREHCDWCGRALLSELAAELADLRVLRRQFQRFRDRKVLEPEVVANLLARVDRYEQQLLHPPVKEPARPVAAPAAPPAPPAPATPAPVAAIPLTPQERRPQPEVVRAELVRAEVVERVEPVAAPKLKPEPVRAKPQAAAPVAKPQAAISPAAPPAPPAPPRKSWLERFTEFLEERNIPLAEPIGLLVGAILIVGPSIALMVSFRDRLEDIPYLKFGVFVAACSAFFGIGLYTYHRWKLRAPGFVWLVIATLMVPLVFWGMTSMSGVDWDLRTLAVEAAALAIFVYLATKAAQVLVPRGVWLQVLGVVGNAAAVLLVARLSGVASHGWPLTGIGLVPVAIFAGAVAPYLLFRIPRQGNLDAAGVIGLFSLLGSAAFSLAVALGLLVSVGAKNGGMGLLTTLGYAAPLFALAAVPVLSAGLAVMKGTENDASMGAYRTAGTTIALVAIAAMVAALIMAWPRPLGVITVGTLDAAALVYLAFRHRLPVAHAGAIACITLVYLLGFHLIAGHVAWEPGEGAGQAIVRELLGASSGTALVGLFVVLGLVAEGLARYGYRAHGLQYAGGAVVIGLASLVVVTQAAWFGGYEEALRPAIVYGIYGLGSLAMAARWQRRELSYVGLGMLTATSLWALWWQQGKIGPLWTTTLAVEGLVLGLVAAGLARTRDAWKAVVEVYRLPALHVAEIAAGLAVLFAVGTAWMGPGSAAHPITAVCVAALFFLTAWGYRSLERTWIASAAVLAGLLHATVLNYPGTIAWPYTGALLAHATLAVLAVLGIRIGAVWVKDSAGEGESSRTSAIGRVFLEPLMQGALLASATALALLLNVADRESSWLAGCLFWIAALWMVLAWLGRWPALVSAAQVVLSGAVVAGVVAWLQQNPWADLLDPCSFQAYGIGLGVLTLAWLAVRIVARRSEEARHLLEPAWPAVDWIVGHAVVVAQFLLVAFCLVEPCLSELGQPVALRAAWIVAAFGPSAWILLGVLALTLIAALWHRWGRAEIAAALVVGATVPYLIAGGYAGQWLSATALRWGLGLACIAGAGLVWARQPLSRACRRIGARISAGSRGPVVAQGTLLATTALPILALTLLAALLQFAGISPNAPIGESFFARLDLNTSYLVPLVLVIAALVGFALRESSAGYAFSAGLVVQMTVILGYLLGLTTRGLPIGTAQYATVVQLATITAAVWAVIWLIARQWVSVWREESGLRTSRRLMDVQLGMGQLGNVVLLAPALVLLVFHGPQWHAWTMAAGSVGGWFALVLATAAATYRQVQRKRPLQPVVAGLVGMAALGLLACTVHALTYTLTPDAPEWGYRALMLGWAVYALLIVLATWWVASLRTLPGAEGPPQVLVRAAAGWVIAAGLAAVALGLKAAFFHENYDDILWGAVAIAIASMAGAAMAVWRREETWAFAAAPGVNIAASLVVWYCQWYWRRELAFHDWWVLLLQANVIATEAVALVWMAARKRLYELRAFSLRTSPLLGTQIVLGVIALTALLISAIGNVVVAPDEMPAWVAQTAHLPGWIALALVAAAGGGYLWQTARRDLFHLLGGLGLAVGALLMGLAQGWDVAVAHDAWLPYHVLMSVWAAVGLGLLALGFFGRNLRLANPDRPDAPQPVVFPEYVQSWVTTVGVLVLGLALLHVRHDPAGPWWSFGAVLSMSLAAGCLGLWLRLPAYVCVSGLLINVAGTCVWVRWDYDNFGALVQTNVLCLAIASVIWSLVGPLHREGAPPLWLGNRRESFAHVAAQLGVALLAALAVGYVFCDLNGITYTPIGQWAWIAWGACVAAVFICLWDRSARLVLPGLYVLGLSAIGLGLAARELEPRLLAWNAAIELAVYALATALAGTALVRMRPVWQAMRIPMTDDRWPENWFPAAQAGVVGLGAALGTWISMDLAFADAAHPFLPGLAGRAVGASAVALLLTASIVTAALSMGRWRVGWQHAAIGLGVLALYLTRPSVKHSRIAES